MSLWNTKSFALAASGAASQPRPPARVEMCYRGRMSELNGAARLLWACGVSVTALACGGATSTGAGTPSETPEPPTAIATPPQPSSTVQPASSTEEPPAPSSPFQPVAELPAPAQLFPVKGAILVVGESYPPMKDDRVGVFIGTVEGDKLTFPDRLFFDSVTTRFVGFAGAWPDQVDLIAIGSNGRTGIAQHYVLTEKGWDRKQGAVSFWFGGMATIGSSVLALRLPSMPFPGTRPELIAVRGTTGGRKLTPVDKATCAKTLSDSELSTLRPTEVDSLVFGGTGAGTVFGFGSRCTGEAAVETWASGSTKSTVTNLPAGVDLSDETQFASGAGDEAWLFADALLHYDGRSWAVVESPGLHSGAVGADGALWAIGAKGALYTGGPKGFAAVPIPNGAPVDDVAVADDGTVWISAGGALLRTKKASDGGTAVKVAASAPPRKAAKAPPKPGSAKCKTNVVVLYGFTKVTPDDYDFPLSRKALKGHTEFEKTRFVVTRDYGHKFFAALVPSYAEGARLAQLIEKEVAGSKPQVVCAEPEVLRELKLDLKTGEVLK